MREYFVPQNISRKKVVKKMHEYFVPKNNGRKSVKNAEKVVKMRKYFVREISIVRKNGKKCVSILYQKILYEKRGTKCGSIFYPYNYWPKSVGKNA